MPFMFMVYGSHTYYTCGDMHRKVRAASVLCTGIDVIIDFRLSLVRSQILRKSSTTMCTRSVHTQPTTSILPPSYTARKCPSKTPAAPARRC